jgi:hypothetical protein
MPPPPFTDLLPADAARAVRRDYFLRLATVGLLALSFAVVVHGALLLPTYQYLGQEAAARRVQLSRMDEELVTGGDKQATEELARVRADATYLGTLASVPMSAGVLRLVLAVPRAGVSLTGFSYAADGKAEKVGITGVAATREALRNYDLALSSAPWAEKVDLPVSVYAKEADVPFTITVTGNFSTP